MFLILISPFFQRSMSNRSRLFDQFLPPAWLFWVKFPVTVRIHDVAVQASL